MEIEEPTKKLDAMTRGQKECTRLNGVEEPEVIETNGGTNSENETQTKGESQKTRVIYSRDDLNGLRDSPASKLWPAFAEEECVRNGVWDPEVWHHTPASAKRCASPVDDFKRQIIVEDGIVLSPQRQSFGQGCHVLQSAPERGLQQERTKSVINRTIERDTREGRNRLTGRVGRGSRSLDYRPNLRERNRNGERQTSPWERNDKEQTKRSKDEDSYSYKRRRRPVEDDGDPEWMTFGPSSISETIELRGFNKENNAARQRGKTGSFTGSDDAPSPLPAKDKHKEKQEDSKMQHDDDNDEKKDADFDINQFFTSDSFLQFADEPEDRNSNESRFCQFFGIRGKRGSHNGSRRSSGAEELLEYSGVSSPSTPRTPSPSQKFMFTPIKPIEANTKPESLSEMLDKTKLDVKPLLEDVLSSSKRDEMRIKGLKRLEDIEPCDDNQPSNKAAIEPKAQQPSHGDMTAFIKLIEEMKTSGNLPEKPQPVIPGLPSHLLPRPPSPKAKTPRHSPSPLKHLDRSASPVEFLHNIIQKQQSPSPSPPQVVPQLNRPYSPLGTPLFKPLEKMRRSPSPLQSMYDHKSFSPLMTPEAFMSQSPVHPSHFINRPNSMGYNIPDKPQYEMLNDKTKQGYNEQTPRSTAITKPKMTPKTQSAALKDLGFMPTSVLQKIKKDQMTPKSKADCEKELASVSFESMKKTQVNGETKSTSIGLTSPEIRMNSKEDSVLLKPTAFKPYQGNSPHSISPHRSGIHSEPQSPQVRPGDNSKEVLPSSAPVTPQRYTHADQQLLGGLESRFKDIANEKAIKRNNVSEPERFVEPQPISAPSSMDNIPNSYYKNTHDSMVQLNHNKIELERPMPLPQNIHHHQQQQLRRENLQYLANMARQRQGTPLAMMGAHSQSILGTPGIPRSPFPLNNVHQGKPHLPHSGMIPGQPLHPGNFRMMPPTRTPSGLPLQSPSLMQRMPQRHPMMYRHGHTPLQGHPAAYHQMMAHRGNFPMMPRSHPGLVHQHKVAGIPTPDHNSWRSPINDNGLSKWFSDDVLRGMQTTTPKIPTEINSKRVMSVEDLERQQALCTS